MTLHRYASLLAAATFALLVVGALVHGTGSGLACPDWPLCHGMVLPPMTGHVLYEHSHRLVAGTVALGTLGLAIAVGVKRTEDWRLVRLALGALGLVVVQALLGALTVWLKLPAIVSTTHLAVSMVFFGLTLTLAARTRPRAGGGGMPAAARRWIAVALGGVYFQILLGGVVRHTGSGLACVDLPLCQGSVLPLAAHPSVIVQAAHRLVALVVAGLVIGAAVATLRASRARGVRLLAWAGPVLVLVQITLGVMSVLSYLELSWVTLHLAVAALVFADLVGLWLAARPSMCAAEPEAAPSEGETRAAGVHP